MSWSKMFKDLLKSMSKKRSFYPDLGAQLHKVYYLMRIDRVYACGAAFDTTVLCATVPGLLTRNSEKSLGAAEEGFTRRARNRPTASLKSGGGGVVAELSTKKSVDSSTNRFFRTIPRSRKCNGGGGSSRTE